MLLYELLGFYVLFNVLICFFPSPPPFVVFHLHSCNSYDNTARASFPTLSYRFVVGQELLGGIEYYSALRKWTTANQVGEVRNFSINGLRVMRLSTKIVDLPALSPGTSPSFGSHWSFLRNSCEDLKFELT